MQRCHLHKKVKGLTPRKTRVQALCVYTQPVSDSVNARFWKLVLHMQQEDVTAAALLWHRCTYVAKYYFKEGFLLVVNCFCFLYVWICYDCGCRYLGRGEGMANVSADRPSAQTGHSSCGSRQEGIVVHHNSNDLI